MCKEFNVDKKIAIAIFSYPPDKGYTCNLDKDIDLPELETYDSKNDTAENRDSIVGQVYAQIMQIESRLLPCGKTV